MLVGSSVYKWGEGLPVLLVLQMHTSAKLSTLVLASRGLWQGACVACSCELLGLYTWLDTCHAPGLRWVCFGRTAGRARPPALCTSRGYMTEAWASGVTALHQLKPQVYKTGPVWLWLQAEGVPSVDLEYQMAWCHFLGCVQSAMLC